MTPFQSTLLLCLAPTLVMSEVWIEGEYLGWLTKETPLPAPLVTSGSFVDPLPGALEQPHTKLLLGGQDLSAEWRHGFRISAGATCYGECGAEASYFLLPSVWTQKSFSTSGEPGSLNLAVPIFDVTGVFGLGGIPGETIFILAGPLADDPGYSATIDLHVSSLFQGADLVGYYPICTGCPFYTGGFAGLQWVQLEESLNFQGTTRTTPDFASVPAFFNFRDHILTRNNFYGGIIGFDAAYGNEYVSLSGSVKGGAGYMTTCVYRSGSSQTSSGNPFFLTQGTASEPLSGGIFVEPTNIGHHSKSDFGGLVEADLRFAYNVTPCLQISLGGSFIWIAQVLRPGDQIDPNINTTLTSLADASRTTVGTGPGPIPFGSPTGAPAAVSQPHPHFSLRTSQYWAGGFTAGITCKF